MEKYFSELVMRRQSCRDFNDKPLEKDVVEKIISLSLNAPSACNSQPWKVYQVLDEKKVKEVASCLQENGHNLFTDKAKAFIALSEKDATLKESISARFDRNHFVKYDIGELIAYITLSAESMGVSSCIIGWINQEKLKSTLNIPDGEICNIVIALGYSDIPTREKKRKPQEELVVKI